ncbi:unnamed protein product [Knipowitschia caucasica]
MSTTSLDKELQERLREASALGDIDEVRALVESGVNVNSQNEINGWTCLHWACKRNHKHIVTYLLSCGADMDILTAKDEMASQLTSKPDIKRLLGVEVEEEDEVKEPELPIVPNYLSNPPFMFSTLEPEAEAVLKQRLAQNGSAEHSEDSQSQASELTSAPSPRAFIPMCEQNGDSPPKAFKSVNCTVPMDLSVEPHLNHIDLQHSAHNGTAHSPPLAGPAPALPSNGGGVQVPSGTPGVSRQQSLPQQLTCSPAGGPMAAFQPFFFTSTFPVNVQELVLKVRIQNPTTRENDFIEIELDRQELTYRSLLRVCCRELDISTEHVEKIRKLPNTMLRKDKDVARLQDFQELEVVLEKAEGLSLFSGGLTDRPCYNMKASRLTY